ncbi:hypothetical protein GCM10023212_18900 [Luteolibacter yonseiensis]
MAAMITEVILLRSFIPPADSWNFVLLGFLFGIMDSVMGRMREKSDARQETRVPEDLEAPAWIRYSPSPAQAFRSKHDPGAES